MATTIFMITVSNVAFLWIASKFYSDMNKILEDKIETLERIQNNGNESNKNRK